jgi:hypothetical protein
LDPIVTNRLESVAARRLVCEACGTEFTCDSTGSCWCLAETVRLPMPVEGQAGRTSDCLCRDCLHRIAEQHAATT